jgi:hypothetical protein
MLVNYYRSTMWCRINRSIVEYVAGGSEVWRNEGLLISHSVVTNHGVSQHLWFLTPTWAWENETIIRYIPPAFVICFDPYTRIFDWYSPLYPCMTSKVIEGIWVDISRNPTRTISRTKFSISRDILQQLCMYDLATSFNKRALSLAATSNAFYWAPCLTILIPSGLMLQSRIMTEATILPACQFLMTIARAYCNVGTLLFIVFRWFTFLISCSDAGAQV